GSSNTVGIGTTTPSNALDVAGTVRATTALTVDNPTTGGFNAPLNLIGRNNGVPATAQIYANFTGGISINPAAGTPNVGINLNPSGGANFQVGGSAQIGFINNTSAPTSGLIVNGQLGTGTSTPWGQLSASSSSAIPTLAVEQKGTGLAAVFQGGNVGIGSTTALRPLTVQTSAATAAQLLDTSGSGGVLRTLLEIYGGANADNSGS